MAEGAGWAELLAAECGVTRGELEIGPVAAATDGLAGDLARLDERRELLRESRVTDTECCRAAEAELRAGLVRIGNQAGDQRREMLAAAVGSKQKAEAGRLAQEAVQSLARLNAALETSRRMLVLAGRRADSGHGQVDAERVVSQRLAQEAVDAAAEHCSWAWGLADHPADPALAERLSRARLGLLAAEFDQKRLLTDERCLRLNVEAQLGLLGESVSGENFEALSKDIGGLIEAYESWGAGRVEQGRLERARERLAVGDRELKRLEGEVRQLGLKQHPCKRQIEQLQ